MAGVELRLVGCEMDQDGVKCKVRNALISAEKYAWVYHIVVLVVVGVLRFGLITAQDVFIDVILAMTAISLGAQAVSKLRERNNTDMPVLRCLKCKNDIVPVGEWVCKECGWKAVFPDSSSVDSQPK